MQTYDLAIVAARKRRQYCFQLVSSSAGRAAEHLGDISFRRAVGKHSTALKSSGWTSAQPLALAMEVAGYFELDDGKAREIAAQVGKAVSRWREETAALGEMMSRTDGLAGTSNGPGGQDYCVTICATADLSLTELERCNAIVTSGGAVKVKFAVAELPRASKLAVVRLEIEIVALGAIKRIRDYYAADIAKKSGFDFDKNMPEVGYIAVDDQRRRRRL